MKKIFKFVIIGIIGVVVFNFIYEKTSIFYRSRILLAGQLHLNKQSIVLKKGEQFQLKLNGINKRVAYSSTDFKVAYVSLSGKIYALKTGNATIIAKIGEKTCKCRVNVISLNKDSISLHVGQTKRIKVKGIVARKTYKNSAADVISVTKYGKVKAIKKGTAYVTVKIKGINLICKIKVT